jgi:hypothetical protein
VNPKAEANNDKRSYWSYGVILQRPISNLMAVGLEKERGKGNGLRQVVWLAWSLENDDGLSYLGQDSY